MKPFLQSVAETFYIQCDNTLCRHTFVFPNRRAGVFFQKYLADFADKPIFSPRIITIQELFESLSEYKTADSIEMLVMLYKHYVRLSKSNETFDEFLFWGEMLLSDFSEVDKHLVDAQVIFKNIDNLKSLSDDMSDLAEEQRDAIRRFWGNFKKEASEDNDTNNTKIKFKETWEVLFPLYTSLREELHKNRRAYEGMMFRDVVERLATKDISDFRSESIVFVGFNALTPTEMKLMEHLKKMGIADFYWDYSAPTVRDEKNKASFWMRENESRFPSQYAINCEKPSKKTDLELIGIPSGVGQAKHVNRILRHLLDTKIIPDSQQAIRTAVVLPDENLLLPLLYSIPSEIEKINVTMGYHLSHAMTASLFRHIAGLQSNIREQSDGSAAFYHQFVFAVLNHPLVTRVARDAVEKIKKHLLEHNRILVSPDEMNGNPLLEKIFIPIQCWQDIADYLKELLGLFYQSLTDEKNREKQEDDAYDARAIDLEREFIVQYFTTITRLQDTLHGAELSVNTYFRLLKRLEHSITVAFQGEPLSGLQIMGVLETRVLDFENIIILSMNEGVYPVRKSERSFIPYSLRKEFKLTTYEHQDSVYAYNFYSMIHRAKRVYMLYDTRMEEMQSGEVSRYYHQLKYLYNSHFNICEKEIHYSVSIPDEVPITVEKTPAVMAKLNRYRAGGDAYLSASLIRKYVKCPLDFYFSAIENFDEEEEVQELIENSTFGSIFHRVMEMLYKPYGGREVDCAAIDALLKDDAKIVGLIKEAFARCYFKDETKCCELEGQNYLISEILLSYVKQVLKADKKLCPFKYVASEYQFQTACEVNDSLKVNIKGSIDRIDMVDGFHRIIDYKSGSGKNTVREITELFDPKKSDDVANILQLFIYAKFYAMEHPGITISPAIYYLKSVFNDFEPSIFLNKEKIANIIPLLDEFSEQLNQCIQEVFDPNVPFIQSSEPHYCTWCSRLGLSSAK